MKSIKMTVTRLLAMFIWIYMSAHTNGILIIDTWPVPKSYIEASSNPRFLCQIAQEWALSEGRNIPRCSSNRIHFYPEQFNAALTWCVYKDGSPIEYTTELTRRFHFNCKKSRVCPKGTVFETTGRCEDLCRNALRSADIKLSFNCRNKCICPEGMHRSKDGVCLWKTQCKFEGSCKFPKIYKSVSECPATCSTPTPTKCRESAKKQCVCPTHMVQYSTHNETCIRVEDCPKCKAPAILMKCEKACPATCEVKPWPCSVECESEYICGCTIGYVQLSLEKRECVEEGKCTKICKAPKVFEICPSLCQPTCKTPRPRGCQRGCNPMNCVCPRGMMELSERNRTCVRPSECPAKCKEPKVFKKCPSMCQPTCERMRTSSTRCQRGCNPMNCVCPDGMVQLSEGNTTCIKPSDCPECVPPKIHQKCPSLCQPTCDFPGRRFCGRSCSSRNCVCPPGMIQVNDRNHTCIEMPECPYPGPQLRRREKRRTYLSKLRINDN